ncbi:WxL domain-containing protein [Enterococcus rotai]|uniref:WxL domain-containing protein n=1 Tax=Enterococcus rotai TaxID=118060 RepID=UPI0035C69873
MKRYFLTFGTVLLLSSMVMTNVEVATATSKTGDGTITFEEMEEDTGVRDPEKPDTSVDPGPSPSTEGKLRIDFVPQLNFSSNSILNKNRLYPVNAQLFKDDTGPRANFVQVSDYRGGSFGWSLQLRQETQFKNEQTQNSQLNGAILSFDKSWANSRQETKFAPVVSQDIIQLNNIGEAYVLAEAKPDTGSGTWSISFGASNSNQSGQKDTLKPKVDSNGQPIVDPDFNNKQVYENNAITLSIPEATKIDPVDYTTVLTWVLAELP